MSQHDKRLGDSHFSQAIESVPPGDDALEILRRAAAHAHTNNESEASIIRELNGPLTALLIYIGEIKEHSHQFPEAGGTRAYLQQVVENALQQTERVCAWSGRSRTFRAAPRPCRAGRPDPRYLPVMPGKMRACRARRSRLKPARSR